MTDSQPPKKLRILICLLYYFPHRTGLTIHVQRVAEELVRRGHEVTVLCARHDKTVPRDEKIHNGVRVVRLWPFPFAISRGMILPAYPWAALGLMLQHDVVSVHTPLLETALIGILSKISGRQVIITHHGDLILPEGKFNSLIRNVLFGMYRILAKRAARIIAYSHDYADHSYYLLPYRDKVSVVYPPIDMPTPQPENVARMRAEWSHDGGPIIGFSGRFVEEKRPDLLIQALETVNKTYPKARLVFAGEYDIPYEGFWARNQALVNRYRDQIIFLGLHKDMQFMANFYAACDVIGLTSDTECFALVQVEAMLCGTPVVMTDTPGGRVPVQKTQMGKLAQQGDATSIGEAIVDVIQNREQYVHSREMIEAHFSFKETIDRYEKLFQQYARGRNGQ